MTLNWAKTIKTKVTNSVYVIINAPRPEAGFVNYELYKISRLNCLASYGI